MTPILMNRLISCLLSVFLCLTAQAQSNPTKTAARPDARFPAGTRPDAARPTAARPEIGKYCKVYRAGEGLKVLLLRVGPESKNESLLALDGFDHPWDGTIFKASVVRADGRQEFTVQNNGRPFVVLVFRERYGQSTLFVPKYGTEETERSLVYSEELSATCKPDILLSQYLNQQAGQK